MLRASPSLRITLLTSGTQTSRARSLSSVIPALGTCTGMQQQTDKKGMTTGMTRHSHAKAEKQQCSSTDRICGLHGINYAWDIEMGMRYGKI